uniref:Uncharacterized protein n=1 Tax=Vitrella brassicaformis TaxID=1169539 RepID=A0A7S1KBH3_9ALVE|mmetsp:Transcript_46584/g.116005  ORF Transcript_46584/g.116005 Transcript_46584/m.116005 type:complete len:146 (+) Transcript_46584:1-438(+)
MYASVQELSDYAVLRLSGLTNCLVIGINIVSSLTSFVGIAIGLGISTLLDEVVEEFARYCLAFTTGAWLAIALLLLTPIALKLFVEMTHKGPDGQPPVLGWFPVSLVTALMMAVALGIMAAIGVLEGMTHAHGGHEGHGHEGHDH